MTSLEFTSMYNYFTDETQNNIDVAQIIHKM